MNVIVASVVAVVAAATAVAVYEPFVGLLAYVGLDFLRPHDWFVELRAYRLMLASAAVTFASVAWRYRGDWRKQGRKLLPIVALLAAVGMSTWFSRAPAASLGGLAQVFKMLLFTAVLSVLVSTPRRFEAIVWVICLSLLVAAVDAIREGIAHGLMREFHVELAVQGPPGNHDGPFRDNNDLARVLAVSVPLWWLLAVCSTAVWRRVVAAIGLALTVCAIEFTFSRGGFLALLAAVAVVALSYRPLWRAAAIVTGFLAAVLCLSPAPYVQRLASIAQTTANASVSERLDIWWHGAQALRDKPLTGVGPNVFVAGETRRPAHNIFVEVAAENGLLGLGAYLWVLCATFFHLIRVPARVVRGAAQPWFESAAWALLAALSAFLIAGLALGNAFQSTLFVLVGLSLAWRDFAEN